MGYDMLKGGTTAGHHQVPDHQDQPRRIKFTLTSIWIPLRAKITFPFILVAAVLALGASFVITQLVFDTIDERFMNQLIESGKLASSFMVKEENRLLETLRFLANAESLPGAVRAGDAEKLRELAYGIAVNNQAEAVEFLDAYGILLLSMRHQPGGGIEEYVFSKNGGAVYLEWEFVRQVFDHQVDRHGDKYAGLVRSDWGDYFFITGPLYDLDGSFVGAVLVGRSLGELARLIRAETLAQISLYDFDGQLLASTFPEQTSLPEDLAAEISLHQAKASLKRDLGNPREIDVFKLPYAEILGAWKARGEVDLGVIGVSHLKNYLVKATQATRFQIAALVGVAFLVVILSGISIANYITRPLIGLVQASEKVTQGDLSVQIHADSNDEVAMLAESFNRMIESVNNSRQNLVEAYDKTLEGWSKALELRDKETNGHTRRVTDLTIRLARRMGLTGEAELTNIRRGALLHDIGKMGISDHILKKPGPLTAAERAVMQNHTVYAYELLSAIEYLRPASDIPYCHHERWDGTGYPRGIEGQAIPLVARIFAVVDVWDALISDRPYRTAMPADKALEIILAGRGLDFDPEVVDQFVYILEAGLAGAEEVEP